MPVPFSNKCVAKLSLNECGLPLNHAAGKEEKFPFAGSMNVMVILLKVNKYYDTAADHSCEE
jgi:hypothetical protein